MDEQRSSEFTQLLATILGSYADATNKLKALESALKEHDPAFHERYQSHLEKVRKEDNSGAQVALALERLQGLLEK
jgi:hypothetical protein